MLVERRLRKCIMELSEDICVFIRRQYAEREGGSRRLMDNGICCKGRRLFAYFFFFQAEDGIRDLTVTGVQTCALPISAWLINMIFSKTAGDLPFSSRPDLRILLFNFSLALLVSLAFSLAPALQFWRPNLAPALKQQAMTAGAGPLRFRRISVAVQIGLSILVLVGAGLFVRTLHNLKSLNVGIETDHLVTFEVQPTLAGYRPDQARDLDQHILQTLAGL